MQTKMRDEKDISYSQFGNQPKQYSYNWYDVLNFDYQGADKYGLIAISELARNKSIMWFGTVVPMGEIIEILLQSENNG